MRRPHTSQPLSTIAIVVLVCSPFVVSPAHATEPSPIESHPCVLLKNDNVLFGQAYQVGEFVLVRTSENGQVKLPRKSVACWADSPQSLYQFRVDQRESDDISAQLRDVKWCIQNDFYDLASRELDSIRQVAPNHPEVHTFSQQLHRLTTKPKTPAAFVPAATPPVEVQQASFDGKELAPVDLATLQGFAKHVQPTLINRCGNCHSQSAGQKWSLTLPTPGSRPSSQITRDNLAATLPFVLGETAEQTELFVRSTTAHGGGAAPLNPRTAKAIRTFKGWLELALRSQPAADEVSNPVAQVATNTPMQESTAVPQPPPINVQPARATVPVDPERPHFLNGSQPAQSPGHQLNQPARLPTVDNPFDPEIFNRRFHMKTTGRD